MSKNSQRLTMLLAFVAFISLGLPDTVLGIAWPSMRATFDLPLSRIGRILIGSMVGYLLSSFFAGQIVRMIGVGRLLAWSGLLVSGSLLGTAMAPAFEPLLFLAVISGLGGGAIDAGINAFAAAKFSPRIVNWLHACFGIGATIGPLLMTAVLALNSTWRVGYFVLAAMLATLTAVFFATQRLWVLQPAATDEHGSVATLAETARRPIIWLQVLVFFVYCGIESTASQLLYSVFRESRGLSIPVSGGTIGGYWASLTVGRIVFGQLLASFSPMPVLRASIAAIPLAAALIWWNPTPEIGLGATLLLGFVLAPVFPTLIAMTPDRVGARFAPQAIGLQVSAATLGIAFFPGMVAVLAKRFGLEFVPMELTIAGVVLVMTHELVCRISAPRPAEAFPAAVSGEPLV